MRLEHKSIYCRLVQPSDAYFILSLRMNEKFNKHLSKVDNDLEQQSNWLIEYKKREVQKKRVLFYYPSKIR